MINYYHFVDGLLERCSKDDLEATGGQRYLDAEKVKEYSNGKYNESGWIAAYVRPPMHYGSDDLGVQGIVNQADGKRYDSKANYYRALKEQGMVVMGDDAPKTPSKPKTKNIDWKQAVSETIKSTPYER